MPRNGSGTYQLPAGNPVVTGTPISSSVQNTTMSDVAGALTASICTDGQTPMAANLPMASNKLTGLSAGAMAGDSLRFEQLFSQGTETTIASAATTDIGGQNTAFLNVTGTTTITSFGTNYNGPRYLRFSGVVLLTNSATLALPGSSNITTAAGDVFIAYPLNGGGWEVQQFLNAFNLINQRWTTFTTAGSAPAFTLTPSVPLLAYVAGQRFNVTFNAAGTTGSNTLNISGIGAGNLKQYDSTGTKQSGVISSGLISDIEYDGTDFVLLDPLPFSTLGRGIIDGLILSTAGASTTMAISAGQAADSTNAVLMNNASSISKTTAAWAVGNSNGGKLSAAAITNSTWYYWYLIRRPDTGIVDVGFDVSPTTPTLPSGYTQYRYIGASLTNGSAQWTSFKQYGDYFEWATMAADINVSDPGISAVLRTLSIPSRIVTANLAVNTGTNTNFFASFTNPATTDVVPSASSFTFNSSSGSVERTGLISIVTNSSKQIRTRQSASGASDSLIILTVGWTDPRGKNA